jgi:hypothetical protein
MKAPSKVKMKKCRVCKEPFMPRTTIQPCCYKYECQVTYATAYALKAETRRKSAERKKTREAKERIKTRSERLKEAQQWFNKYIRLRDMEAPCISCGRFHSGQYHAGHYRTVGANPELRFNELNVHKQCSACNNHLSGNIVQYRMALVRKIGLDAVAMLEGKHEAKHYTNEEIDEIKAKYKSLCRELEKQLTREGE